MFQVPARSPERQTKNRNKRVQNPLQRYNGRSNQAFAGDNHQQGVEEGMQNEQGVSNHKVQNMELAPIQNPSDGQEELNLGVRWGNGREKPSSVNNIEIAQPSAVGEVFHPH